MYIYKYIYIYTSMYVCIYIYIDRYIFGKVHYFLTQKAVLSCCNLPRFCLDFEQIHLCNSSV